MRVGPPLLQPFYDIAKLMIKETCVPAGGARALFLGAPLVGLAGASLASLIIWRAMLGLSAGVRRRPVVVLYLLTLPAVGGGARLLRVAQPPGVAGRQPRDEADLRLRTAVRAGGAASPSSSSADIRLERSSAAGRPWRSLSGLLALLVAVLCMQAKLTLVPFDAPEAETELTGGAYIEYSGPPLAMFKLTRAMMLFTMPVFLVAVFCGGIRRRPRAWCPSLLGVLKYVGLVVVVVLIRNTAPRVRIDQAMKFFWGPVTVAARCWRSCWRLRGGDAMSFAVQALTRSLNVFHLAGSACNNCDIEILDALTPRYDLERFGIVLVGSVRHADVLLLSGIFNKKSAIRARRVYEQAPQARSSSSRSAAAPAAGLMFKDSYNWDGPIGDHIPVDAYVPGARPSRRP